MSEHGKESRFVFPKAANWLLPVLLVAAAGGGLYLPVVVGLGASPQATAVGYAPVQPVPYSHAMHVGQLGMDCRYCHTTVEKTAFAALPPTQTCMNCHTAIRSDSPKLLPIRESWATGMPVNWVKVHDLPDYAYFNHSAHVNKGVGCVECHGRVDHMDVVQQVQPLSMSWCLDCHRNPEERLRPRSEVTNMGWQPPDGDRRKLGLELKKQYGIRDSDYMTSCTTCHR